MMLDTCSLLDIVREPMREDCKLVNVRAAMAMLMAAEAGSKLTILIAEQVSQELTQNANDVMQTAGKAMHKYIAKAQHIDLVASEFGATGSMNTAHLVDHSARANAIFSRWVAAGIPVPPETAVSDRASHRVRHAIAPSRRGKENFKDCFVIESYLEVATQLNAAGFTKPMVFGSSNTSEYMDQLSKQPPSPLDAELRAQRLEYAPDHRRMKMMLGV